MASGPALGAEVRLKLHEHGEPQALSNAQIADRLASLAQLLSTQTGRLLLKRPRL